MIQNYHSHHDLLFDRVVSESDLQSDFKNSFTAKIMIDKYKKNAGQTGNIALSLEQQRYAYNETEIIPMK